MVVTSKYRVKQNDPETAKALNDLARHQMIKQLLADILIDMQVCEMEGYDKMEYINMIKAEMDRLVK